MGGSLRLPLHPHVATLLAPVLPEDPTAYVFAKRGSSDPWDRNSYRDRWARLRNRVAKDYPVDPKGRKVADWWLRDLRKLFKTRLLEAGVNPVAVKVLMGHALTVDERYYEPTEDYLVEAVLMLNWQPSRVQGRVVARG